MGGGGWSVGHFDAHIAAAKAAGRSPFDYSDRVRSGRTAAKVHEMLDPKKRNAAGLNVREARNSDEHPNATPIAVIFDVTGSMGGIPMTLQKKLPQLHGLLQRKGYVEDPQILFGAVGDGYSDRYPLQIGQFESDNRMDDALGNIILEGGGGGGNHESYELAAYYLARHAELDACAVGRKGYLFLIGDERIYSRINRRQVEALIGDTLEEDLSTEQIFRELQAKFEVFFLFAAQGSYEAGSVLYDDGRRSGWSTRDADVLYWRDLLGQNALTLDDAGAVCETIALTIGLMEGTINLREGLDDLRETGSNHASITAVGKALELVGNGEPPTLSRTDGSLPSAPGRGADRL